MINEDVEELIKFINLKTEKEYSDDFPIYEIENWIREFFKQDEEDRIDMELIAQSEKEIAEDGTISLEEWEKRLDL